jgi:hypothetical protein
LAGRLIATGDVGPIGSLVDRSLRRVQGVPHQPDGQHLTPEGHRMLAEQIASEVAGAIGR